MRDHGRGGASRFSLHAMRHAAASQFIEQGWPPEKIQVMLGHSRPRLALPRTASFDITIFIELLD
ncbi:site-specific integrase [Croceicoccus ponticola]|uniref:Site-specific integrase n=1 Tax=Croceicoccus ponticola TaxID=2217664 RepID=A0A437GZL6_9SPHN|nr:site-specific integrase [Croceicoccus ponticola]